MTFGQIAMIFIFWILFSLWSTCILMLYFRGVKLYRKNNDYVTFGQTERRIENEVI